MAALARISYDAVRMGHSPYTPSQRAAWMPRVPDLAAFSARLDLMQVAVASVGDHPVGFVAMTSDGYIDLAYILNDARGRGLFRQMLEMLEYKAHSVGTPRLSTHASVMAQPAFQALGFSVIQHETVERAGETLRRAEMEKHLL